MRPHVGEFYPPLTQVALVCARAAHALVCGQLGRRVGQRAKVAHHFAPRALVGEMRRRRSGSDANTVTAAFRALHPTGGGVAMPVRSSDSGGSGGSRGDASGGGTLARAPQRFNAAHGTLHISVAARALVFVHVAIRNVCRAAVATRRGAQRASAANVSVHQPRFRCVAAA